MRTVTKMQNLAAVRRKTFDFIYTAFRRGFIGKQARLLMCIIPFVYIICAVFERMFVRSEHKHFFTFGQLAHVGNS